MWTAPMIGLLVLTAAASTMAAWLLAVARLGRTGGTALALVLGGAVVCVYRMAIRPWHLRWGATDEEVARAMPGDDLLPGPGATTRVVTIAATPEDIWPWLVQLGYGKAGWYSYDWIDNDFQPSADRIVPELQDLAVGDRILMMPSMGFEVVAIDEPHSIVSLLEDGSTSWCLALYPTDDGTTRLVSRWRPRFERSLASFFMLLLVEPGTFLMEQKMLRTIRDRVEATAPAAATGGG
jgi:hypothetical protein